MQHTKISSTIFFSFFVFAAIFACCSADPIVSLANATLLVQENNTASVLVLLDAPVGFDVTGHYRTLQTAAAVPSDDYVEVITGDFTVPAGEILATILVETVDDTKCELVEYFTVEIYELTSAGSLSLETQTYIGIVDDEPGISIFGPGELDESATQAVFNVSMSCSPAAALTVSYATSDKTAEGGSDYRGVRNSLVQIIPGEKWRPVFIDIINDSDQELKESFDVTLTGCSDGTIIVDTARVTIPANDWPVITTKTAFTVKENVEILEIEIKLSKESPFPVTVAYSTLLDTAWGDQDFVPNAGVIFFPPFKTEAFIEIEIIDDPYYEEIDETFKLILFDPSNAVINNGDAIIEIVITIISDDPVVRIAPGQRTAWYEGEVCVIVLVLEAPAPYDFVVRAATTTKPDETADPNEDYVFFRTKPIRFSEGDTEANFTVTMKNDTFVSEGNETFSVTFTAANATMATPSLGLIVMNVLPPFFPDPEASVEPSSSAPPSPAISSPPPASSSVSPSPSSQAPGQPSPSAVVVQQMATVYKTSESSAAVTGSAFAVGGFGVGTAVAMGAFYYKNRRRVEEEPDM